MYTTNDLCCYFTTTILQTVHHHPVYEQVNVFFTKTSILIAFMLHYISYIHPKI